MYFSEIPWMVEIICPKLHREYGLVEHLQLLCILIIFVIVIKGTLMKHTILEKIGWGFLGVFTAFVFLEEMDYGKYYYAYFAGHEETFFSELTGRTNIHNINDNAKWFKRPVYPLMGVLFILFPLYGQRFSWPFFRYLVPNKLIIGTAIITILTELVARGIILFGIREDGGFANNIGEFTELLIYYIFSLYVHELVYKKNLILPMTLSR